MMMKLTLSACGADTKNNQANRSSPIQEDNVLLDPLLRKQSSSQQFYGIVGNVGELSGQEDNAMFSEHEESIGLPLGASQDNNSKIVNCKYIFNTDTYVKRYSHLSDILENRHNPLISNKGKIQSRVFQDGGQIMCDCHYPDTCQLCFKGGQYVSRKDRRYSRKEEEKRKRHPGNMFFNQTSKEASRRDHKAFQSGQQGIECEQPYGHRSDLRSHISKSMDSQHLSKHLKKLEQHQDDSNQYYGPQKSGSHYVLKADDDQNLSGGGDEEEDQLGNQLSNQRLCVNQRDELDDDENEYSGPEQHLSSKPVGGVKRKGGSNAKRLVNGEIQDRTSFNRTIEENLANGKRDKSLLIGEKGLVLKGKAKKGGQGNDRHTLQKLGSRERFARPKFKVKQKAVNNVNINSQSVAAATAGLVIAKGAQLPIETGQSPPSGWVRAALPAGAVPNSKAAAGGKAGLQLQLNPFMKPSFLPSAAQLQPQDMSNQQHSLPNTVLDSIQNPKKKQGFNEDSKNPANLDLSRPKVRPLSNSSNQSAGGHDSSMNNEVKNYNSQRSYASSVGKKSCFMSAERRSSRKLLYGLDSNRVKFHESIGKYSEEDEENKHYSNRRKYKKFPQQNKNGEAKDQPPSIPDVKIMINMRRFVKEVNIKGTDPLISMPYFKYFLLDAVEKKKYLNDVDISKHFVQNQKKTMLMNPKLVQTLQSQFLRAAKPNQNQVVVNFKDLAQVKNAIKCNTKKTIVFDMDNTIMTIMYKKNEIQEYDAATYVKLFGHSALKIYLNYRPYLKEMLSELKKNDFELILFSSHNAKYLEQVAATIQKDEPLFDYLINKDHLHFDRDLDLHILDLNILLGNGTRDLKDIIVVSNTLCRHLIHYTNGVPVKEYSGNKRDLSLYALTKYLKSLRDVKDVRAKVSEDFGIQ